MLHLRARGFAPLTQRPINRLIQNGKPPRYNIRNILRHLVVQAIIEMTPLCKVEVTLPWVSGSREVRHDGGVDEQAGKRGKSVGGFRKFSPRCDS